MARTDEVVDAIKTMILAGDLRPGDRLPVEKDLAAQLGLSRGSLREGVRAFSVMPSSSIGWLHPATTKSSCPYVLRTISKRYL